MILSWEMSKDTGRRGFVAVFKLVLAREQGSGAGHFSFQL